MKKPTELKIISGVCQQVDFIASPNFDNRPQGCSPEVIIIHSISLPPGDYSSNAVEKFFCNQLDKDAHPYFADIHDMKVSAHFFIRRDGAIIQFVNTNNRAWHAGLSECLGRDCVNDFSIGIEVEGWDEADDGFSKKQYTALSELSFCLMQEYSIPVKHFFRHSDIAPERKSDPGLYFKWDNFIANLSGKVNS